MLEILTYAEKKWPKELGQTQLISMVWVKIFQTPIHIATTGQPVPFGSGPDLISMSIYAANIVPEIHGFPLEMICQW